MSLLQQAPRLSAADAVRLARNLYGLDAAATPLPSERDQNFLLRATGDSGTGGLGTHDRGQNTVRYVLKIANATEDRAMLEAQNAAMAHVADPPTRLRRFGGTGRVALCPHALPTRSGDLIGVVPGGGHFVRLVTYVEGVPLAEVRERPPALFESLGRAVGRLDRGLEDFDHPAIHRDFHWDLARAGAVIQEHLPRVTDHADRQIVERITRAALPAIERHQPAFRRSAVHHDANDWNVLVSTPDGGRIPSSGGSDTVSDPRRPESRTPTPEVVGIIDFGDMVHSWTVADPAVAVAYAMLDAADPLATAEAVIHGYQSEHPLHQEERAAVFPLACLRLCMSACIAAWQQAQRAGDEYLAVSQQPIRRTLPALATILERR
jgi:Ser/Thr protein kinase RdoA (MazF antagonist)